MSDPAPSGRHPPADGTVTHCRIVVTGVLPLDWGEWFADLEILPGAPSPGETILTGPIADQAGLHGIIARVRDLGLPLVSAVVSREIAPVAGREHRRNEKDQPACDCDVRPPNRRAGSLRTEGGSEESAHPPANLCPIDSTFRYDAGRGPLLGGHGLPSESHEPPPRPPVPPQ
jgi:hypothetical protein